MKNLILSAIAVIAWLGTLGQPAASPFEINERLGRGVNMGNSFEGPGETEWGNQWQPDYFRMMAELGFEHVRLPVRWEPAARSSSEPPYTVSPDFLRRIQQVVDTALRYKLHIVVNMHHHDSLFEDLEKERPRFISQWSQIAAHFQHYPDSLLFEVLNEPHGSVTPELWNGLFAEALGKIRETNPTRTVLVGTAEWGGIAGLSYLQLPDDEHLLLTIHYYSPFNFTHQGAEWVGPQADAWLGTKWSDTEAERETVENDFRSVISFSQENNIPLHVGEFGVYSKADIASREKWTTFLARWFEQQGMSWAYWEFSAGFGIYNPTTDTYLQPLVDALLFNPMPEPALVNVKKVYEADFSSGTDGWTLTSQGGANASLSASQNALAIDVSSAGSESWHVQLVKTGLTFTKGKNYKVSFEASATAARPVTLYAGKNGDPWTAYSGYSGVSVTDTKQPFSFTFTMTENTDLLGRLAFDFGKSTTAVSIYSVLIEEISLVITDVDDHVEQDVVVYPNPTGSTLFIDTTIPFEQAFLFDMRGRFIKALNLGTSARSIDLTELPEGVYLLKLWGKQQFETFRIVKQ